MGRILGAESRKFPVFFPVSREHSGDWLVPDWALRQLFLLSRTYGGSYHTLVPVEEPLRKVKVNLTKYVATVAGLRHCPAVITSNGRIKQDIVVVNGQE
jgi:hypothetical protein